MKQAAYLARGLFVAAALALLCAGLFVSMTAQQAYADSLASAQTSSRLSKGDTFTVGGNKYKVIKVETDKGEMSEVALVKYGSKNKKPNINTVKYNGETFKVDTIGKNAFNNKAGHKVVSVKLGRHVDDIGAKAFYGCKKLKVIDMRKADVIELEKKGCTYEIDDLDIGKNAFKKAGKKHIKVKCGKSDVRYRCVFKKALMKKGLRSSAIVTK